MPRNEVAGWFPLVAQKAPTVRFSSPLFMSGHLPDALALLPVRLFNIWIERLPAGKATKRFDFGHSS